tara:strand:+ start:84494 stop:85060 length:567 start_codon:yes stop_codon:yes gene_type:complete
MNLHKHLRENTRSAHGRVDQLFGGLMLSTRRDYLLFLQSHYLAHQSLEKYFSDVLPLEERPPRVSPLLAGDLLALGVKSDLKIPFSMGDETAPLGVSYVIAGAHFGQRVLRSRWARSSDRDILDAGAYLTSQDMALFWPIVRDRMEIERPSACDLTHLVRSANATFGLFEYCFDRALREVSHIEQQTC